MFGRIFKIFLVLLMILFPAVLMLQPGYRENPGQTAVFIYGKNILHGRVIADDWKGYPNGLDLKKAEPGDIILGGNRNGAWGHFSHMALYIGQGQVLEGYCDYGVTVQPALHFQNYDSACILRVKTSVKNRQIAVRYALRQLKRPVYVLALKKGDRTMNCGKLVWASYMKCGIDLDSFRDVVVLPDSVYCSPHVERIAFTGVMPQ